MGERPARGWALWLLAALAGAGGAITARVATPPAAGPPPPAGFVVPAGLVADADLDRGTGTDCAPAINAALASGLPVVLPPGRYAIRSTIRMTPCDGWSLRGTYAGRVGPDDPSRGTWLVWCGPPGGTVLAMQGIKSLVQDVGFICARSTSVAVCVDVESPPVYPNLSSQNGFTRVVCDGRWGPVNIGWQVGQDGQANNEFHLWDGCLTRYCAYAGISVPSPTRQVKDCVCQYCTFGGAGPTTGCYGVVFNSGSMKFYRCNFDALGAAAAWFGAGNEPITFQDCTGETNGSFLNAGGCSFVNLLGCRLALNAAPNPQVLGQEFLRGGQNWSIIGCDFEDGVSHYIRPADGGSVFVASCQFNSAEPFPTDDATRFRLTVQATRVGLNNLLPEGGNYWLRNVPGIANAGGGLLLWDGHWPLKGTYGGGTYQPGANEGTLFSDSGKLYWRCNGSTRQLQTAP